MIRRLLGSSIARLAAAIFLLQVLAGTAAMILLRQQVQQIVATDRAQQIMDVRDDLLGAFYDGGYDAMAAFVRERRGGLGDPVIFMGADSPDKPDVFSHIARMPAIPADDHPVKTMVVHAGGGAPTEALALSSQLSDGTRIVVGASIGADKRFDLAFAEAITITVLATVLLSLGGAVFIGATISRRTHAIAMTAEKLAAGDFAARVQAGDDADGFAHLRRQLNFMAERIGHLVSEMKTMSVALAHDLRSPVARLRASIEQAQALATTERARSALDLARSDAESLDAILGTSLELARLESGAIGDRRQALDLAEVVQDLVELYEPLAEQAGVVLTCRTVRAVVLADRELISRALANLIDNALKFGADRVDVTTASDSAMGSIIVADNGPGIAAADRARAVDRYARLDNARTAPGSGLGLAMVSAVARLHGGTLELADEGGFAPGGLVARIRLPLY